MTKINEVIDPKTLEELLPVEQSEKGSNLIELTTTIIESVLSLLKQNKTSPEIKWSFKDSKTGKSLSLNQIKRIESVWKARILDLTPAKEIKEDKLI